ncbi:HAD family hydrolase [Gemmatimonas sp.]|uniref:HAD family hydrolase n=1 Tax=Gemmatimonas sp. TaxID=1962908 RepID=UPI0037BF0BF0
MKVVLFDIDGTLLRTDGAGRRAMEQALFTVFGAHGDPEYRYDGKTDRQITREQMRWAGVSDDVIDARMHDVFALYAERLAQELASGTEQAVLMQGIPPLLERLGAHEEVTLGLLTGNIEAGARQKLRAVQLAWEQFLVNAFGSDHEQRPMLPSVAQQRAAQLLGREVPGERMVIIGDTPADIHCGRSLKVRAIGVATGRYSVPELLAHNPADVFETLADTDAVVESILA